jgi:hypothetical protein
VSKKKKKKSIPKPKPKLPVEEVTAIEEVPLMCTCVGKILSPAGANFQGVVKSQRYVKSLGMLIVYFEQGFCCNANICRVVEGGKN